MSYMEELKKGFQYAAFGYFFLYINITINKVDLLPAFVGYILFLEAIKFLRKEERELNLLDHPGRLLIIWNLILWILKWFQIEPDWQFVSLISSALNLYFHFQLLTNLASIAGRYEGEKNFKQRILMYRTLQTVILTAVTGITCLESLLSQVWQYVAIAMAVVYLILGICLIKVLLDVRAEITG